MEINTEELRQLANLLFDHLIETGHQQVSLPHDYYWSVPDEAEYDPYQEPTSLTLGQLSDDINELKRLLKGDRDPVAYDLVSLASVLRAVGQEVVG